MLKGLQSIRYEKHIDLPMFGEEKQLKLLNSKVAIIGAGGLGCPVCLYLCASGVGHITLIDDDEISLSNLPRQTLYSYDDLGKNKVNIAKEKLNKAYPDCNIEAVNERITDKNAEKYFADSDIIIDATDNFKTRYLLNEIAIQFSKPLLSGSVVHYTGQVITFHPTKNYNYPCYACLYPEQPDNHAVPACLDSGVLSPVTGTIGSIMATQVIKQLTNMDKESDHNELLIYSALDNKFDKIKIKKSDGCKICAIS